MKNTFVDNLLAEESFKEIYGVDLELGKLYSVVVREGEDRYCDDDTRSRIWYFIYDGFPEAFDFDLRDGLIICPKVCVETWTDGGMKFTPFISPKARLSSYKVHKIELCNNPPKGLGEHFPEEHQEAYARSFYKAFEVVSDAEIGDVLLVTGSARASLLFVEDTCVETLDGVERAVAFGSELDLVTDKFIPSNFTVNIPRDSDIEVYKASEALEIVLFNREAFQRHFSELNKVEVDFTTALEFIFQKGKELYTSKGKSAVLVLEPVKFLDDSEVYSEAIHWRDDEGMDMYLKASNWIVGQLKQQEHEDIKYFLKKEIVLNEKD